VDAAALQRIARLARLRVSDAEAQQLAADLDTLLSAVAMLEELEPAEHEVQVHGPPPPSPAEPDPLHVPPSYIAPEWRDGFFTVPAR
jgi:hypothetical protein